MQQIFESLKAFSFSDSSIHLWVFKRSATNVKFTARYVQTNESLNRILRTIVQAEMSRVTEFAGYSYLSETNENSCLAIPIVGSDFEQLKAVIDRPEPEWRVRNLKDLKNATGYAVKFNHNGQTIYAIKRSASNWKTSFLKTHINIIFSNGELSAAEDNGFSIEKTFDFYSLDSAMYITSKRSFESIMEHRASYVYAFTNLQSVAGFSNLFTDLQPLISYVGNNSIQLRRMARIEERALFALPGFLPAVQSVSARRGWGLNFDPVSNRIVPCG